MKMDSELKKFEEVCELVGGSQPSKDEFIYEQKDGYVRLIQVRDYRTDKFITYIPLDKAKRFCSKDDIMIGRYGPPIFGIFKGLEGAYNVALMKAVVNEKICDRNYFYWFLNSDNLRKFVEYSSKRAAGQDGVRKELLDKYPVYVPPLPEQQRIVAILDEAFAAIAKAKANAEQNLKNAKELFESYLQGVFENKGEGWEERKVNEIGNAQTGTTPKTEEKENYGDFIPFIKPADVDFSGIGDIRYENEGLSEMGLKKGRKMESGSILMVCIGATIGKVGFAEREISCNQQINSLTVKKEFLPKFIYYAMTSKEFQKKVLLEGKGAQATLPIINKSKWEKLTISFPKSISEQQSIVRQLDALRTETQRLEAVYKQKLADLEELKKSILQKAFAGELTGASN